MSEGETDILADIVIRLAALKLALDEDAALIGRVPRSVAEFEAMASAQRSGSRALMKSFEQFEDQLARSFRLVPTLLGVATDGWYIRDFANFMEKNHVVRDADEWMEIVKLRNRLVHDYPLAPSAQFEKLVNVLQRIPSVLDIHSALIVFIKDRGLGP